MLSELDSLYLDWIWQLDSVARLNNVWWANLRFDLGYDLSVIWLCTWFQVLVSVHTCTLVLAICMWCLATCIWQLVSCIVLINQFTWFNLGILLRYMVLFYIPASSQYCIFQLQVQLYFHFQLDFLLPVLVFDKGSPVMLSSSPRCKLTSPRCNALLYRFRI